MKLELCLENGEHVIMRTRGEGEANTAECSKTESESRSAVPDSVTPWTIQSMGFSRPEYWTGEPFPSPGDLPSPGIEPRSPALQVDFFAS